MEHETPKAATCQDGACTVKDRTVDSLVSSTIESHNRLIARMAGDPAYEKKVMSNRAKLARHIESHHRKKGTLTEGIQSKISLLSENSDTAILMTAHQTNFMPYSGVLRKTTLMHVIGRRLRQKGIGSVEFFGLADQDMAGSWPWLNMTQLPSIFHKNGILELTYPQGRPYETKIHAAVPKPTAIDINTWRSKVGEWVKYSLKLIEESKNPPSPEKIDRLYSNMDTLFSKLAESLYNSDNFADYNASVLTKAVNEGFGHDTLFAKYTECQHIFAGEFIMLLENSSHLAQQQDPEEPENLAPFWYHCECLGKVSLTKEATQSAITLTGKCPSCGKHHKITLNKATIKKDMATISRNISARARPMALVFFEGLGVSMYVGGALANKCYLNDAKTTSRQLGTNFPPLAVWRPRDIYAGIGQLSCTISKTNICGSEPLEPHLKSLESELETTLEQAHTLDTLIRKSATSKEKESLIQEKNSIMKSHNLNTISRKISTLKKIQKAESVYPSFIDYAINIGLKETAEAWAAHLETSGNLSEGIRLKSILEEEGETNGRDRG